MSGYSSKWVNEVFMHPIENEHGEFRFASLCTSHGRSLKTTRTCTWSDHMWSVIKAWFVRDWNNQGTSCDSPHVCVSCGGLLRDKQSLYFTWIYRRFIADMFCIMSLLSYKHFYKFASSLDHVTDRLWLHWYLLLLLTFSVITHLKHQCSQCN